MAPLLSVIIPSYNKATELNISLPLLKSQTVSATNWQLIVIDDGSFDATCEVVKRYATSLDLTLVSLDPATRRASRARNVGAECATAPHILFLDPDVLPAPGLIEAHLKQIERRNQILSLGYMYAVGLGQDVFHSTFGREWDFTNIDDTLRRAREFSDLSDARWSWADSPDRFSSLPCPWAGGWTGNLALSRDAFFEVGGFDESFVDRGMEDIELSYRLHQAGFGFELTRDAVGFHYPHPKDHTRAGAADAANSFALLKKYPLPEIELLKVFSCAQLNKVLPCIRKMLPTHSGFASLDLSPVFSNFGRGEMRVCIAGCYSDRVSGIPTSTATAMVRFTALAESANGNKNSMPLLGIATPFETASFDIAIVVDSWATLPFPLAAIQLEELSRISSIVVACSTSRDDLSARLSECNTEFIVTPLTESSSLRAFTIKTRKLPRCHQELFLDQIPPSVEDQGTARVWTLSA
jgi:glycosyltransferase involved in cell wall biosynthesis